MRATPPLAFAVSLSVALCGCAGRVAEKPFHVAIREADGSCNIEAGGRVVTLKELEALARPVAQSTQRARISGGATTSYRCIGGTIYALQMAGFTYVDATGAWSRRD